MKKAQQKSFTQTVLHGVFISYFFSFLTIPLAYFLRLLYARNLTLEEYGLFYALIGVFAFLAVFND